MCIAMPVHYEDDKPSVAQIERAVCNENLYRKWKFFYWNNSFLDLGRKKVLLFQLYSILRIQERMEYGSVK